jgi:DtxR family Mn-dependent transcriptional regulator
VQSRSIEDYIKYIYQIQLLENKVSTSSLARKLKISPASVSGMLSKLSGMRVIKNTPYHGFVLTSRGEKMAVKLIRKHRIIEVFLHQLLNYGWDEVHAEADGLEHACSDKFIEELERYLHYPKYDPHGDPIPDISGKVRGSKYTSLADAEPGKYYVVSKVIDTSNEVLRYLTKIGIKLNSRIHFTERIKLDNSVLINVKNKKHLLSRPIAGHVFVTAFNRHIMKQPAG